jgi:hypothetical protein
MEKVFNEINNNNIFVNLDSSYCYTEDIKPKYDISAYIGIIESSMENKEEIIESLKEEGSVTINYRFTTTAKYVFKKTVIALLKSIFNKYNYETYIAISKNKKFIEIEVVVSRDDLTDEFKNELINNEDDLVEDVVEDYVEDVAEDVVDNEDNVDVDNELEEDVDNEDVDNEDVDNEVGEDVDNELKEDVNNEDGEDLYNEDDDNEDEDNEDEDDDNEDDNNEDED